MIVEHEVITFAAEEPRALAVVLEWIAELGRQDPEAVVRGLVRGGWVELCDANGVALPDCRSDEVLRALERPAEVFVLATEAGLDWGYS
ncbi:MAG: hypothetical protein ACYS26_11695 [Planctomycetota bacterium]|jgi:hypothetical protein